MFILKKPNSYPDHQNVKEIVPLMIQNEKDGIILQ